MIAYNRVIQNQTLFYVRFDTNLAVYLFYMHIFLYNMIKLFLKFFSFKYIV